jgi:DNA (cytosine-5)-methyltransferase 1
MAYTRSWDGRKEHIKMLTSVELCAGAGGQALGLEQAGFGHEALVEIDAHCCATLRHNRPEWKVIEDDLRLFKERAADFAGVDLVAGGLPCPPFSVAGKQLGEKDERNLFPDAVEIVDAIRPKAVMIENVRGFLDAVFHDYREGLKRQLGRLGYETDWRLLNASHFGVPQLRPRVIIVAVRKDLSDGFEWPEEQHHNPPTVGETLYDMMAARGWPGAKAWRDRADEIAPTIVGGSKKHGGPDLGPTRARRAWETLGVNGKTVAEEAPDPDFVGMPRLTVPMVARIQGFPDDWHFTGRKTNAYRQVGNAFPPPVARAVAERVCTALSKRRLVAVAS